MTIRAENLEKHFNGVKALRCTNVEFNESKITAIIGPNGAGKTTLVDALTGFLDIDSGRCFIEQIDTTQMRPDQIARLGVARTFQEVRLVWGESVIENVMAAIPSRGEQFCYALTNFGLKAEHDKNYTKALEVLQFVGLRDLADTIATDLSYGQQKLLEFARCLATEARWLILDEPVSGISPVLVESMIKILRSVVKEGRSIVFIEHDIKAVKEVADVVVVLDEGRVVVAGATAEVLARDDVMEAYVG